MKSRRKEREKTIGSWEMLRAVCWRCRVRSESERGAAVRERRRESGRRMSPVAVGAEEKRVTRCWVGL